MREVKDMTTAELLAEYNELTGKSTKRFASLAKGEAAVTKARAASEKKAATPKKVVKADVSEAVAKTWRNKEVREKRSRRDAVMVNGEGPFRSCGAAFKHFRLPMGKCVPFRAELKEKGALTFTVESTGNEYKFKVFKKAS